MSPDSFNVTYMPRICPTCGQYIKWNVNYFEALCDDYIHDKSYKDSNDTIKENKINFNATLIENIDKPNMNKRVYKPQRKMGELSHKDKKEMYRLYRGRMPK